MANLTASLKRAPKWAWYVSGGLALGAVGIEVWKRRAADTPSPTDTSNAATVAGSPVAGSAAPSPVITPPVIIQPQDNQPDFTGMFGVFGDALNNAVNSITGLASGDQGITQTAIGTTGDIAQAAIAAAGQAPSPASQVAPIIVRVPTPATTPSVSSTHGPAGYPNHSARGWFKCEKNTAGNKKQYPWVHVYAPSSGGARIASTTCP